MNEDSPFSNQDIENNLLKISNIEANARDIKQQRERDLMLVQQQISQSINKNKVGKVYEVLIEDFREDLYIGRSYEMAPNIDGDIYIKSESQLELGQMIKVKITESSEYDLIGVVYYESC